MNKVIISCLIMATLLSGCANNTVQENETGHSYQSVIELEAEPVTELLVNLPFEDTVSNYYLSADGTMSYGENYTVYRYDVTQTQYVRIEGSMVGNPSSASRIAFYEDEEGTRLVKGGWLNEGGWDDKYTIEVSVPEEAKFLFVSTQNGTVPNVKATQSGTHYYISSEGEFVAHENYQIFSYAVRENERIQISGSMKGNLNSAARYAFYQDESGIKLRGVGSLNSGGWEDEYSEDVIVPSGASTLLIACQNGTEPTVIWKSNESYKTHPELENKKLGVLGDSMAKGNGEFDGNCWPERIAARNGMEVDNQSINGKYLTQDIWKDSVIGGQVDALSDDCDIIIICAGTNDIVAQIPIGEDDSTDTSTLCGTINVLIPKLREKCPNAKILCITPFVRYERNEDGTYTQVWERQKEWINKLAELCDKWDVPCFNNSYRSDIEWNNDNDRRFFTGTPELKYGDDYHLNNVGLEYISYLYESFIVEQVK